ncbi:MAG: hypothetical protein ACU0BG_12775, partial [Paracoccus sp. (in: a-proteobacteria)]|uniref:hypothetical protein n=1 Tax=Paracoccus sp. TaxID=267 RepID=UPI004058DBA2
MAALPLVAPELAPAFPDAESLARGFADPGFATAFFAAVRDAAAFRPVAGLAEAVLPVDPAASFAAADFAASGLVARWLRVEDFPGAALSCAVFPEPDFSGFADPAPSVIHEVAACIASPGKTATSPGISGANIFTDRVIQPISLTTAT